MKIEEALSLLKEQVYFYCEDHECENTECEDSDVIKAYETVVDELNQSLYYRECRDVWRGQAESLHRTLSDMKDFINSVESHPSYHRGGVIK